jgi:hypothetical protein
VGASVCFWKLQCLNYASQVDPVLSNDDEIAETCELDRTKLLGILKRLIAVFIMPKFIKTCRERVKTESE